MIRIRTDRDRIATLLYRYEQNFVHLRNSRIISNNLQKFYRAFVLSRLSAVLPQLILSSGPILPALSSLSAWSVLSWVSTGLCCIVGAVCVIADSYSMNPGATSLARGDEEHDFQDPFRQSAGSRQEHSLTLFLEACFCSKY